MAKKYIVLDTETTGLEVKQGHRVIEIGAVLLNDRKKSEEHFHSYLNPSRLIDEEASKVHGITNSDLEKTKLYKEESQRKKSKIKFKSNNAFLKSLKMIAKIDTINDYNLKRVFQLIQKTNQFNTTNRRYSQNKIKEIIATKNNYSKVISLKDNYGDYGIISCIILSKIQDNLIIDTWIMSCREIGRAHV